MEYISLQEASNLCPYSQEYLSLRARQGKLKAVKLGRNWVSTKNWLHEYIEKCGGYKNGGIRQLADVDPPRNLPIYAPDAEMWEEEIPADIARQQEFQRKFQFAFAVAMVAALFFGSVFHGRVHIVQAAEKVSPLVISIASSLQDELREKGFAIGNEIELYLASSAEVRQLADEGWGVGEIANRYVAWLGDQVRSIAKFFVPETPTPQGLVVVPAAGDETNVEKLKDEIRQTFSDEVQVIPHDGDTGIITPVFKSRTGEDYLYILVPLKHAQ